MSVRKERNISGRGLMVLETPLLKVSRPVAACSRCRSAKIKCDGKLPACSACEKNGKQVECASANDHFARGKERSYVSTLETRVEKLERKLKEEQLRKSSVISIEGSDNLIQLGSIDANVDSITPAPAAAKAARRKEARDIDDLVSDFGYLTVAAAARDFYGFTSAMSYARLILSACSKDRLPAGLSTPLPPRHLVMLTIQKYLDNVYTILPFFDETSLYYSVDAVYNSDLDLNSTATQYDHWCVRLILAIANAMVSEQRGDSFYLDALGHAAAALKCAEGVLIPGTITTVQALLFLAEYAMVDPHHFDSWSLIGAASRAMLDLGLHQDPPKGTAISKAKLELRRRVYWCVYMLDRSTSIVQTRAFSFSDDSAHVSMPPMTVSQAPRGASKSQKWLKGFDHAIYLIRLRRLQSTWYHDLFQSGREPWTDPYPCVWRICQDLANWFTDLSINTSNSFRSFFELELLYSYIYLLAPSPRVPITAPYAQNLIFEHCISYANLITSVISNKSHVAPVTFYDAMRVYMTGRQFIDVLTTNQERLLSGGVPEPPRVPVDSVPAPPLPLVLADPKANTTRSITCIKQLTECLGQFGLRWGYMSWRDSFEKVAEPTLTALNQRLWELQEVSSNLSSQRRQSQWHHASSSGSVPSVGHLSRESSYNQQSPYGNMPNVAYGQQYFPQTDASGYAPAQGNILQPQQSPPAGYPPQANAFDRPTQQFATWSGMDAFAPEYSHAQPGAEEEEQVPPL